MKIPVASDKKAINVITMHQTLIVDLEFVNYQNKKGSNRAPLY